MTSKSQIISYLMKFGSVEVLYPKYENQGSFKATESYYLTLKEEIEPTEKLLAYCKLNNVLIQQNLFNESNTRPTSH